MSPTWHPWFWTGQDPVDLESIPGPEAGQASTYPYWLQEFSSMIVEKSLDKTYYITIWYIENMV